MPAKKEFSDEAIEALIALAQWGDGDAQVFDGAIELNIHKQSNAQRDRGYQFLSDFAAAVLLMVDDAC